MFFYSVTKFLDSTYRGDKVVLANLAVGGIINLFMWGFLYSKISPFAFLSESGHIPLHYNLYFGIDNIGAWYKVFILPLLGLFILFFNMILGYIFYIPERVASYFLVTTQTVVQCILLAASVFIVLLNT